MAAPAKHTSKAERTRAAVLAAAESLFAARGFEATRLEDVAEQVGIRRASIVYYFRDKRDLYESVLLDVFTGLLAEVRAVLDGAGPLAERVDAAVSAWVDYVARRPSFPRLLLREVLDAGGEAPVLRTQTAPFFALVSRVLTRNAADPLMRDPHLDAAHVASAIAGTSVFYLTALPALVPELAGDLSEERLRLHREQLLLVARRLLAPPRRTERR
ncbi:MAG TPA: TetR family transcriptional regulator [Myxococcota bacterium]|nr:TetR family transcriptional regulator [Myxococcota bacterium]